MAPELDQLRAADRLLLGSVRHCALPGTAILLLSTTGALTGLALPAVLGRTLDLLLSGRPATAWLTACAALTCLLVVVDALDGVLTGTTNARSTVWFRRRLLGHVLAAGPRCTDRVPPGDVVARLVGNAAHAGGAPATLAGTLAAVVTPVGGFVALALVDLWTAGAFLVGMPLLALLLKAFVRASGDSVARYQESQGEIAARLVEAVGGARTIAAAGTARRERARVLEPLAALSAQGYRMWRVQGRSTAQAAVLVPLLQIAVLTVAGTRLAAGELSVGGLLAAARYAALATGIGMLVGRLNGLVRSRGAARRLAGLLAVPATAHGDAELAPGDGTLELRGVTVAHGGRTILDRLDLTVPGGTSLALVGRSGSGKSTVAAVAGRLADPDAGTVTLDGVPLRELPRDVLRRAVGQAFERPALLGATIGGTIAFGPGEPDAATVREAARTARADDFVRRLPHGYDTPCAEAPLSGGEAQRLGLARAFAHPGRLLILDDATSSLDTVTELRVAEALTRQAGVRTRLIIAHRASTAARADRVAWLHEGRIRAVGPHARLWEQWEDYRAVFTGTDDTPEDRGRS
ncbi:ABC transporter ATP-binding protein [Streptomyces agglomeratus]|uniref:ABC transporter ATP-binding protein n=1 Tax=Streptomyces agglomeratus TaxID=285458 RepID=A0A1E5PC24_9ACTN|nr:ABC transporter ATP-binding protein [Streptomyces agglomeratus]OEJ27091.1 ABC transporter ATP-binding protein [Streptomyces agglomeratus]OEJ51389.1 ABC transporter ATP-binding protein [Streptomyces agglomeratus]OEJ58790.1 ABC transporter ATP-binding protein [Streptomyces agglomeratus]